MPKREPEIPDGDDATIRAEILRHLMRVLRGDAASSARLVVDSGRVMGLGLVAFGSDAFVRARQLAQGVPLDGFKLDLDQVWSLGSFRAEIGDALSTEMKRTYWTDSGVRDALGMYIGVSGRMVGYVTVYRATGSPPFNESDRSIADALAPWVAKAFERAIGSDDTRDVAAGRYLFDASGRLRFASERPVPPRAASTLGRCAAEFLEGRRLPESILGTWRLSTTRLTGDEGDAAMIEVRRVYSGQVPDVMRLTPTKRRIAAYAARGATASQIAEIVGRHAETVRAHLKEIYEILGVSSRVELADACRTLWSADAAPTKDPESSRLPKDA